MTKSEIYILFLIISAVSGSLCIILFKRFGKLILGTSIFTQRINILILSFFRSIQLASIFAGVTFLLEFIKSLKNKKYITFLKSRYFIIICILFLANLLSVLKAYDLKTYFVGLLIQISAYLMASAVYLSLLNDKKVFKYIFIGLIIGSLFDTLISFIQTYDCLYNHCLNVVNIESSFPIKGLSHMGQSIWANGMFLPRSLGMFGDVNFHSFMILSIVFVLIGKLFQLMFTKSLVHKNYKIVALISIIILLFTNSILSLSRSGFMGFVIISALFLLIVAVSETIKKRNLKAPILIISIIFISIISSLVLYFKYQPLNTVVNNFIINRFDLKNDGSAIQHFYLIKEAFNIGKSYNPVSGMGVGVYSKYYTTEVNTIYQSWDPHSWIALTFAEQGLIGLIITSLVFLYTFVLIIYKTFKYIKNIDYFILSLTLVPFIFIVGMIFYYGLFSTVVWIWFGISYYYLDHYEKNNNITN